MPQALLALELNLEEAHPLFDLSRFGQGLAVVAPQRLDLGARHGHLRLGLGDGKLEGLGVQPQQRLADADGLVVLDAYPHHACGDVGADGDDVGFDVGVLGDHVAAGLQVEVGGAGDGYDRHDDQQQRSKQLALTRHCHCHG